MVEYFQGLDRDILIIEEQQLAASTVVWPLLTALNQTEKKADALENKNQLLKNHIERLDQELNILMGKKPTLLLLTGQVHNVSVDSEQDFKTVDLVEQGNINSKLDLEAPPTTDPVELCPIIIQKKKRYKIDKQGYSLTNGPPPKRIFMWQPGHIRP